MAYLSINALIDRVALIGLSVNWETDDITEKQIKKSAFHECFELKLIRIDTLANDRFITKLEIDEELHEIVRTFENLFYEIN